MASFADDVSPEGHGPVVPRSWRDLRDTARLLAEPRYLVAAGVAVPLVGFAFARLGAGAHFAVAAYAIVALCLLSAIDVTERRLPNRIVLPSLAIVLALQTALLPDRLLESVAAAVGASLLLLLPLLVSPGSVGMGDVKLALLVGAVLGGAVVSALVLASVTAAAYAAFLLVRDGAAARQAAMPFGPFLAFGTVVALLI